MNEPTCTPEPSDEGSSVTCSATASDDGLGGAAASCTVDYGDPGGAESGTVGGTSTAPSCGGPAHTYADDGDYTVQVCITDFGGLTDCEGSDHAVANVAPSRAK